MAGRSIGSVAVLLCLLLSLFWLCCCAVMPPFVFPGTVNSTEFEVPCRGGGGSHASRLIAIAGFLCELCDGCCVRMERKCTLGRGS